MSFGDVAFSGSRFIFWCLAPVLLLCGVALPFLITEWSATKVAIATVWSTTCLLAIPALYDAKRFYWAARGITAVIFLAYAIYLVQEWLFTEKPFVPTARSQPSPYTSLLGFVIIGLPALWYTLFGRFTFRARPASEEQRDG